MNREQYIIQVFVISNLLTMPIFLFVLYCNLRGISFLDIKKILIQPFLILKYGPYTPYYLHTRKKIKIHNCLVRRNDQIVYKAYVGKELIDDEWRYRMEEVRGKVIGVDMNNTMYVLNEKTGEVITYGASYIAKEHLISLNDVDLLRSK